MRSKSLCFTFQLNRHLAEDVPHALNHPPFPLTARVVPTRLHRLHRAQQRTNQTRRPSLSIGSRRHLTGRRRESLVGDFRSQRPRQLGRYPQLPARHPRGSKVLRQGRPVRRDELPKPVLARGGRANERPTRGQHLAAKRKRQVAHSQL